MVESLKPGQTVRCTITKAPIAGAAKATIARLMRLDATVKRGLKRAQRRRRQNMVVYNRGNRDWYKRATCGRIIRVESGATWTLDYTLDLAPDFRSVDKYVSVKPA